MISIKHSKVSFWNAHVGVDRTFINVDEAVPTIIDR